MPRPYTMRRRPGANMLQAAMPAIATAGEAARTRAEASAEAARIREPIERYAYSGDTEEVRQERIRRRQLANNPTVISERLG
jgi:GrpB-like predicted nucleotidyltransferase (UPF0157 family)